MIASGTQARLDEFYDGLSDAAVLALPYLFEFWALPHQLPPEGSWRTWLIMGGRGAGKTRAGAEWVRSMVEGATPAAPGEARRVALIGETYDQAREVMVLGESGLLACSPPDRRPVWEAGRRLLQWPNGATAQVFSATDPEALRGPQFDAAWVDELAKFPKPEEAWDMLQFALRLGEDPRAVVTTTPRNVPILKDLLKRASSVMTHAPTRANRANLSRTFLDDVTARYGNGRLGRQELDGELIEEVEGALWTPATLEAAREMPARSTDRIVVAIDPPATGRRTSDACGIIVAGVHAKGPPADWQAVVLEDATVSGQGPTGWAAAAVDAYRRHGADRIVAEVNQGGDMVEAVLRQIDPQIPYRPFRAHRGKAVRAEPVAALYERGRVRHVPGLGALEAEMEQMTVAGYRGAKSPDRVDALVWALHELMLAQGAMPVPRIRDIGRN